MKGSKMRKQQGPVTTRNCLRPLAIHTQGETGKEWWFNMAKIFWIEKLNSCSPFPLGSESEEMSLPISAAYEEELLNHYDDETLEENSLWSIESFHS